MIYKLCPVHMHAGPPPTCIVVGNRQKNIQLLQAMIKFAGQGQSNPRHIQDHKFHLRCDGEMLHIFYRHCHVQTRDQSIHNNTTQHCCGSESCTDGESWRNTRNDPDTGFCLARFVARYPISTFCHIFPDTPIKNCGTGPLGMPQLQPFGFPVHCKLWKKRGAGMKNHAE